MNRIDLLDKETAHMVSKYQFVFKRWERNLVILLNELLRGQIQILLVRTVLINEIFEKLTTCLIHQVCGIILLSFKCHQVSRTLGRIQDSVRGGS